MSTKSGAAKRLVYERLGANLPKIQEKPKRPCDYTDEEWKRKRWLPPQGLVVEYRKKL